MDINCPLGFVNYRYKELNIRQVEKYVSSNQRKKHEGISRLSEKSLEKAKAYISVLRTDRQM